MNIHSPAEQVLTSCLALGVLASGPSASFDAKGFTRAKLIVFATTGSASVLDASLEESSDNGATDPWTAVSGSSVAEVPASSDKAVRLLSIDLTRRKRYVRVQMTVTGTVNGSVSAELYNPAEAPVSQPFPASQV